MNGVSTRPNIAVMAPKPALPPSSSASTTPKRHTAAALPPFARAATAPGPPRSLANPALARSDPSHLAPEDAYLTALPPRRLNGFESNATGGAELMSRHLRLRSKDPGSRSRSRRRKRPWKKLLWVKQSCGFWVLSSTSNFSSGIMHQSEG